MTIFSAAQPVESTLSWAVPGGNYRGGGIWLRYSDGAGTFSPVEEADLHAQGIAVSPAALHFLFENGGPDPVPRTLVVEEIGCEPFTWSVYDDAGWLHTQRVGQTVQATVDPTGLNIGTWQSTLTVDAGAAVVGSPVHVPVTLIVADQVHRSHLPAVGKH